MINHEILSRSGPWVALDTLTIPVKPHTAERPKKPKAIGKARYSPEFYQWREKLADYLGQGEPKFLGPLAVAVEMVSEKPKRTKRDRPRFDNDNGYKAITDCITRSKTIWYDDDQIITSLIHRRWAVEGEEPHIKVDVYGRPS